MQEPVLKIVQHQLFIYFIIRNRLIKLRYTKVRQTSFMIGYFPEKTIDSKDGLFDMKEMLTDFILLFELSLTYSNDPKSILKTNKLEAWVIVTYEKIVFTINLSSLIAKKWKNFMLTSKKNLIRLTRWWVRTFWRKNRMH